MSSVKPITHVIRHLALLFVGWEELCGSRPSSAKALRSQEGGFLRVPCEAEKVEGREAGFQRSEVRLFQRLEWLP